MTAAGFVLTGGQSVRMGRDKALLPFHHRTLIEALAATVRAVAGSATLIGQPERYAHLGLAGLPDLRPGLGPLSGLETVLSVTTAEFNVVLACDTPGVEHETLRAMLAQVERSASACVIARDATGQVHPLCGVYRPVCLPAVRRALDERRLRAMTLLDELDAGYFSLPYDLSNLNTPEDWANWKDTQ